MKNDPEEETCLKPIGPIAQAIEAMPMRDFLFLMVGLSKLDASSKLGEPIIIGKND